MKKSRKNSKLLLETTFLQKLKLNFEQNGICYQKMSNPDQIYYLTPSLGPFKYETLNDIPHIAVIREFASINQTKIVQNQAAGKMRATPLQVAGNVESYTKFRTSKVMYMNENVYSISNDLSQLINLALKFNVSSKFGSENYQVMNYGLGGTIITHLDSTGGNEGEGEKHQEHVKVKT